MNEELIASIQIARFTPVRMAQGYDMGDVDQFLDRLVAALAAGQPVGALIEDARFARVRWREGYQVADVDLLLDRVLQSAAASQPEASSAAGPEGDLVAAIRAARFSPVRIGEGYDIGEVDAFLDAVTAAVSAGRPVDGLIDGARFAHTHVREGYSASDVDEFLARLRESVESGQALDWSKSQTPSASHEQLAEMVSRARFTRLMISGAFDRADVDRFLDRLAAALRAGEPVEPLIDGASFAPAPRWREGYSSAEVHQLLAQVRSQVTARPAQPGSGPPAVPEAPSAGQSTVGEPLPSAIVEQRGLLSRVFGRG